MFKKKKFLCIFCYVVVVLFLGGLLRRIVGTGTEFVADLPSWCCESAALALM